MKTYCSMTSAADVTSFKQFVKASLIIQVSLFFLWGCGSSDRYAMLEGRTMGTTYHVTTELLKDAKPEQIQQAIDKRLAEINKSMSTYMGDSEISRFNDMPVGQTMQMGPDFMAVFMLSRDVYKESDGAFNPSVAALVDLWGFGPRFRMDDATKLPTEADLEKARQEMGFDDIKVDGNKLTKAKPVRLDFSAVAKGYAVDEVADVLRQYGMVNYMVEIGGEVRTMGNSARGGSWRIRVEAPEQVQKNFPTILQLHNSAMATSGDYRNFFERDGKQYSHTIDPKTGKPVTHTLSSVTVIADSVADADAWATALLVMGEEDGYKLAKDKGMPVFMIFRTDNGFDAVMTEPMRGYLTE